MTPYPPDLFRDGRRHFVVLAHQDDELPYAGILQSMGPESRFVWVTNGDGLAFETGEALSAYGERRWNETIQGMEALGIGPERLTCLGHSEVALYDLFARMVRGELDGHVPARFAEIASEVEAGGRAFAPDVVWTLAWQGGHPEHDLTHLCARRLVRRLSAERGAPVPFYELPAYELGIVALRFKPWRKAPVHELRLTDDQFLAKTAMMACYPSQTRILTSFRRLLTVAGKLSALRGRPFTFDDFGQREVFAPVPDERDMTRSTHLHPRLDYPGDDYEGTPIRFERTLAPIARALAD